MDLGQCKVWLDSGDELRCTSLHLEVQAGKKRMLEILTGVELASNLHKVLCVCVCGVCVCVCVCVCVYVCVCVCVCV